jgi:acyl carrier protein
MSAENVQPTVTRGAVLALLADFTHNPDLRAAEGPIPLAEYGLDSFGMFEFLLAFEKEFGITIDDHDFDPATFESVDAIVAFAQTREARPSGEEPGPIQVGG